MAAGALWRSRALPLLLLGLPGLQAQTIEPYHAKEIKPFQAQEVKPYRARKGRTDADRAPASPGASPQDPSFFLRTFGLAVPGVAYSWDDLAAGTRTHVLAAGALTRSSIRVNPDHTYVWNSTWDGKLLQGRWILHKDGILLQHGQEGKDWVMGRLPNPSGSAIVYLYDGNHMTYHGTPKPGGR